MAARFLSCRPIGSGGVELRPASQALLACRSALCRRVSVGLERKWSPQQIAGWLKRQKPLQYHSPAEKFAECVAAIGWIGNP